MSYIYLASPYSDKSHMVRHARYLNVSKVVARLLKQEIFVFSPIVHCHEIARTHSLPKDFSFWQRYDRVMLEASAGLWVLQLEGWSKSVGVQWELDHANKINLPIKMLTYPLTELPK